MQILLFIAGLIICPTIPNLFTETTALEVESWFALAFLFIWIIVEMRGIANSVVDVE